jgi:hypothetical protein
VKSQKRSSFKNSLKMEIPQKWLRINDFYSLKKAITISERSVGGIDIPSIGKKFTIQYVIRFFIRHKELQI